MGNDAEDDLAVDGEGAAAGEVRAEPALDHGEYRLYLPALSVHLFGEVFVKLLSVVAGDGGIGLAVQAVPSADSRGEDALYPEILSAELVECLALVAGICKEGIEPVPRERLHESRLELGVVELRAAIDNCAQDDVASCVANCRELRPAVL
jgi:hypothetical protein